MSSPNSNYCKFKFKDTWLLQNDLYNLIKDIWSNLMKSSCVYQLLGQVNYLNIQSRNKNLRKILKVINLLSEELSDKSD